MEGGRKERWHSCKLNSWKLEWNEDQKWSIFSMDTESGGYLPVLFLSWGGIFILFLTISSSGGENTVAVVLTLLKQGLDFPCEWAMCNLGISWGTRDLGDAGVTVIATRANLTDQCCERACKQKLHTFLLLNSTVLLSKHNPRTGYQIAYWDYPSREWESPAQK